MKVQMIAQLSGTRDGQDWPKAGEIIDLPEDEATQLLGNRLARIPEVEEHATKAGKSEKATMPRRDPRPPRKGLTTKDV